MGWRNYSSQERQEIAADYERSAQNATRMAEQLEAKGANVAAGTYRRSAEERQQVADAARDSSDALNEYFNG